MKHLKKIFENKKVFDLEYVKYCFQDFLDDGFEIYKEPVVRKIDNISNLSKSKEWHGMIKSDLTICSFLIKKILPVREKSMIFTYEKTDDELSIGPAGSRSNRTVISSQSYVEDVSELGENFYEFFEMMEQAKNRLKDQEYDAFYSFPSFDSEYRGGERIFTVKLHCNVIQSYS